MENAYNLGHRHAGDIQNYLLDFLRNIQDRPILPTFGPRRQGNVDARLTADLARAESDQNAQARQEGFVIRGFQQTNMELLTRPANPNENLQIEANVIYGNQQPYLEAIILPPNRIRHNQLQAHIVHRNPQPIFGAAMFQVNANQNHRIGAAGHGANPWDQNPNYLGNPNLRNNRNQWWLADADNCAFWITRLPRNVTINTLLESIEGVGRVFTSNICNGECQPGGPREFAAAKVVFFAASAGRRFWSQHGDGNGLWIGGIRAHVVHNRVAADQNMHLPQRFSRVVVIQGPRHLVNTETLTQAFIEAEFFYDLDMIIEHHVSAHDTIVEWRFAAWQCQAENAVYHLVKQEPFRSHVRVRYGYDPCDFFAGHFPVMPSPWETEDTIPGRAGRTVAM